MFKTLISRTVSVPPEIYSVICLLFLIATRVTSMWKKEVVLLPRFQMFRVKHCFVAAWMKIIVFKSHTHPWIICLSLLQYICILIFITVSSNRMFSIHILSCRALHSYKGRMQSRYYTRQETI